MSKASRRSLAWLRDQPIAHRGLHDAVAGIPENSLSAFDAARKAGYGIELDVRLSHDGTAVVFHDTNLKRLTGCDAKVENLNLNQLSELRLSNTDECIPTLCETLKLVAGRIPLFIEIKNSRNFAGPLESAIARQLQRYTGRCAVISFNPISIDWFARRVPDLIRGQSSSHFRSSHTRTDRTMRLKFKHQSCYHGHQPDFLIYDQRSLTMLKPRKERKFGFQLLAFTICDEVELNRAKRNADNVIFEHIRP